MNPTITEKIIDSLKGIPYPGDLVSIKFKNLNDPRIYPGSTILPIIAVEFLGQLLWTSTHDYRKLLENSLVREPFEPFLRRACLAVIEKSNYLTEAIKK
jgi:hypothetical protein